MRSSPLLPPPSSPGAGDPLPPPPLPPRPQPPSSVFEAVRIGDFEALLRLYATAARDAARDAFFLPEPFGKLPEEVRRPPPPAWGHANAAAVAAPSALSAPSSATSDLPSSRSSHSSSSLPPTLRELDALVRDVVGIGIFEDEGRRSGRDPLVASSPQPPPEASPRTLQPHKKTRQHSPPGRGPSLLLSGTTLPSDARLLHPFHRHGHGRRGGRSTTPPPFSSEVDWEELLRESAAALGNSRPSDYFVATRADRLRREEGGGSAAGPDLEDDDGDDIDEEEEDDDPADPIFEGSVANATPGPEATSVAPFDPLRRNYAGGTRRAADDDDFDDAGGGGRGTALHLACLLDSPLSLALLVALGADVDARHTAFRRLPSHEAACADSPACLAWLVAAGERGCEEEEDGAAAAATALDASARRFASSAAGRRDGSFDSIAEASSASDGEGRGRDDGGGAGHRRRPRGKKFAFGWGRSAPSSSSLPSAPSAHMRTSDGGEGGEGEEEEEEEGRVPSPTFATAMNAARDAIKSLRAGELTEAEAAARLLDEAGLPRRARALLARQLRDGRGTSSGADPSSPPDRSSSVATAASSAPPPPHPFAVGRLFQLRPPDAIARPAGAASDRRSPFRPPPPPPRVRRDVDGHGNTPLHWAAFKDSVRALDVLLVRGRADVDARASPSGWTALHDAAYSDARRAVRRLVAAGADVDARSRSGATPLCFAAQEDAPGAARALLDAGADPAARCLGDSAGIGMGIAVADHGRGGGIDDGGADPNDAADDAARRRRAQLRARALRGRFSGYTPVHYCAHYDAARAARVLLDCAADGGRDGRPSAKDLLEIPDLNDRLPIHVAAGRGSSLVLRELLRGGARVETSKAPGRSDSRGAMSGGPTTTSPVPIIAGDAPIGHNVDEVVLAPLAPPFPPSPPAAVVTPVSSPVLRAMIPSRPIASSKPWNCLSQGSIDACRRLVDEVEMEWTPERHVLFSPADRVAVVEVLRVGKRLERVGRGIFRDLWPHVLGYCGRGWFDPPGGGGEGEDASMRGSASASGDSSSGDDMEESFTQFQLEETDGGVAAAIL